MPLYATYYATLCHFSIFHQTVISYGKSIENNAVIKKYDCDLRVLQAIVAETDNSGNGKVGMVKVGTAKWKQWKRKQWKQFRFLFFQSMQKKLRIESFINIS